MVGDVCRQFGEDLLFGNKLIRNELTVGGKSDRSANVRTANPAADGTIADG